VELGLKLYDPTKFPQWWESDIKQDMGYKFTAIKNSQHCYELPSRVHDPGMGASHIVETATLLSHAQSL